jgi:hypothetical protein
MKWWKPVLFGVFLLCLYCGTVWLGITLWPPPKTVAEIRILVTPGQADEVKHRQYGTAHTFTFRDRRCADWFAELLRGCFHMAESAPSIVEECKP